MIIVLGILHEIIAVVNHLRVQVSVCMLCFETMGIIELYVDACISYKSKNNVLHFS